MWFISSYSLFSVMARGHQKIKSQQNNAKKTAAMKSSTTSFSEQKKNAAKALTFSCPVCKVRLKKI